jgi:hypothetical protein
MPGNFSATIFRKATTVYSRQANPNSAEVVSKKLCHRKSTADTYYAVHQDRISALEADDAQEQGWTQMSAVYLARKASSATVSQAPEEVSFTGSEPVPAPQSTPAPIPEPGPESSTTVSTS